MGKSAELIKRIVSLGLVWVTSSLGAPAVATNKDATPLIGQPLVQQDVRVMLLSVERLGDRDRQTPHGLAAGGLRLVWLVENRPGIPFPPVLGDVRVLIGSRPYNSVTNATSQKPFAPNVIIHDPGRFFAGAGRPLQHLAFAPRSGAVAAVLEVHVRGDVIPSGARGTGEIELGDSAAAAAGRPVHYVRFRFQLPPL